MAALGLVLSLTFNPAIGLSQPRYVPVVATGYCLRGKMTNGERTHHGCIALSRPLARDLGLKIGKGQYAYAFGALVELVGTGTHDGIYIFKDLMPSKWAHYRVDVWMPQAKTCYTFGVKRCQIRRVERATKKEAQQR